MTRNIIKCSINGKKHVIKEGTVGYTDPVSSLAEYLSAIGLHGTKVGCAEGGCGACAVTVSRYHPVKNQVEHLSNAACMTPLAAVDQCVITTVEGLVKKGGESHEIQREMANLHGTQCGYCTPGFVMAVYSQLARNSESTAADIEECLDGNLCRCTGYRPQIDAARKFGSDLEEEKRCVCSEKISDEINELFPEEYKSLDSLHISHKTVEWYRPTSLAALLDITGSQPPNQKAVLLCGNTEIGYKNRYWPKTHPVIVHVSRIPEMLGVNWEEDGVRVGASTTINSFKRLLESGIEKLGEEKTRGFKAICLQLRYFANNQVREMGSIGGSLVTCDTLSDLYPGLVCLNSRVRIATPGKTGLREMPVVELVHGKEKGVINLNHGEVVVDVFVPYTKANEFVESYKQGKRRVDAQSIANAGLRVLFEESKLSSGEYKVADTSLCFGAVGNCAGLLAKDTQEVLMNNPWNADTHAKAMEVLKEEAERFVYPRLGMTRYRISLVCSFFHKFLLSVNKQLGIAVDPLELSAIQRLTKQMMQHSGEPTHEQEKVDDGVGKSIPHLAADLHARGEAKYTAELELPSYGLYAAPVLSKRAHAKILSIDDKDALSLDGVKGFVDVKDIPGQNVVDGEEIFADEKCQFFGQVIGVIVAETPQLAREGARLVKVEYFDLPIVQTIEEAIENNSYYCHNKTIERGANVDEIFANTESKYIIEGNSRIGGQEHFYIETTSSVCYPNPEKVVCYTTSQNPTKDQTTLSKVLDRPLHQIEAKVDRLGGGFGGKQDRPRFVAAACAVAAEKMGVPVKMHLDRMDDMVITGQRHEFLGKYKVAFSPDGKLTALDIELFANGGWTPDLSVPVLEVAMFSVDNCYMIPNIRIRGSACKTNRPSCTAFRGFGKPQGIAICEGIIQHVAHKLCTDQQLIKEKNLYRKGDSTPEGTLIEEDTLWKCWVALRQKYDSKLNEVEAFNKANKWKKRGISLTPVKNNVGFDVNMMNQAGALVNIYLDGSVGLSHSGIEMGQGIHTKMVQVCATALGVPVSKVRTNVTSTNIVPNTNPTAASSGTDLNGGAVLAACAKLKKRLDGVKSKFPDRTKTWEDLVKCAYMEKYSLSAKGYFSFPNFAYDWHTKKGSFSYYFIWGAALSVVEVDVLTGSFRTLSTDIVQDAGTSINPAIDIGQAEGGFVQGMGLYTLEELIWAPDGHLRTRNVSTYKIPTHEDAPLEFNVSLIPRSPNEKGCMKSKTVAESGIQLGFSVAAAIRNAVDAARMEQDSVHSTEKLEYIQLSTPITCEKIRMSCKDRFIS